MNTQRIKKKMIMQTSIPNNDFICVCKVCYEELDMNWVITPDYTGYMTKKGGLIKNWKKTLVCFTWETFSIL